MLAQILDTLNKITLFTYVATSFLNTRWGKEWLPQRQAQQQQIQLTAQEEEMIKRAAKDMDAMMRSRGKALLQFSEDGNSIAISQNNAPLSLDDHVNAFLNNHPSITAFLPGVAPGILTALGCYLVGDESAAIDATMNGVSVIVSTGLAFNAYMNYRKATQQETDTTAQVRNAYIANKALHSLHHL